MTKRPVCSIKDCEEEGIGYDEKGKKWYCRVHWRAWLQAQNEARQVASRNAAPQGPAGATVVED